MSRERGRDDRDGGRGRDDRKVSLLVRNLPLDARHVSRVMHVGKRQDTSR